jgi:hypothetical protein
MVFFWVLVLIGAIIIFEFIVPLQLVMGDYSLIVTSFVKILLSVVLVLIWIIILYKLTEIYLVRKIKGKKEK